jgi:stage V sporulation protein D (sporulation-specific penicillin-binding protein)
MKHTLTMMRKRIAVFLLTIIFCTCGLAARLFYLQVLKNEKYQAAALTQRLHEIEIQPKRGLITDRNGKKLAINVSLDSVVVNPRQIKNVDQASAALAEALGLPVEQVRTKLSRDTSFEWVARKIEPEKSKAVRALKLDGVYLVEESDRFYPNGTLLSHVIGFAGIDNQGLEGLELVYDKQLRGTWGRFLGETDAYNREIPGGEKQYLPSKDGCNLILTIDEVLQHIVEREIDRLMEETKAKGAAILIADPNTGEILALANRPTFDPNNPTAVPDTNRRNLAVWYNYEPGSTFKIVTAAAAMEEKLVQENDGFYCQGGLQIAGHYIGCVTAHGSQTFAEVVKNSCNVGFMTIGMRMTREKLYEYIQAFGFGQVPGSSLPGEETGILLPVKNVGPVEQANISFGQGIAVTPLQMISMVGVIANGGQLMKPQIVREIKDTDGTVIQPFTPQTVRQVISSETAHKLAGLLEQVVADGTGRGAQVPGYRLAGKTGTAQKIVDGRYVSDKHVASFLGFGPVDNPRLSILVVVDEPQGAYYGGVVAAPVFKRIMEDALRYLAIPPVVSDEKEKTEPKVEVPPVVNLPLTEARKILEGTGLSYRVEGEGSVVIEQTPPPGTMVKPDTKIILERGETKPAPGQVTVPNVTGQTMRQVAQTLAEMGLTLKPIGTGLAVSQDPPPKSQVPAGSLITVQFQPPAAGPGEPASPEQ